MRHYLNSLFIVWSIGAPLAPASVRADPYPFPASSYNDSATAQWRESDVTLPAYPTDAALLLVPVSAGDTFKLYIDRVSLSLGTDKVARLTLVVESPQGVRNIFYEGFRCETREHKTYAIGSSDRQWSALSQSRWQSIRPVEHNGFRYQLYKHYVCDGAGSARTPVDLLQVIANIDRGY